MKLKRVCSDHSVPNFFFFFFFLINAGKKKPVKLTRAAPMKKIMLLSFFWFLLNISFNQFRKEVYSNVNMERCNMPFYFIGVFFIKKKKLLNYFIERSI